VLFHGQLTARSTQPVDRQYRGDAGPGYIGAIHVQMLRKEFSEAQLLPQLQAEIRVAKSTRALHPDLLHQHPGYIRIIGHFCFGGEQLQLRALPVLIENLDRLLPTRMSRTVQLPEITECALSRTIRRSNGLDQRPVSVFLAIFMDAKLSQEHAGNLSRLQNANKGVGFHYIYFRSMRC
jgi:hypothetical protein